MDFVPEGSCNGPFFGKADVYAGETFLRMRFQQRRATQLEHVVVDQDIQVL